MGVLLNQERYHDTIQLKSGDTFIVKDHRGFKVFEVTATGDVKHKGRVEKI